MVGESPRALDFLEKQLFPRRGAAAKQPPGSRCAFGQDLKPLSTGTSLLRSELGSVSFFVVLGSLSHCVGMLPLSCALLVPRDAPALLPPAHPCSPRRGGNCPVPVPPGQGARHRERAGARWKRPAPTRCSPRVRPFCRPSPSTLAAPPSPGMDGLGVKFGIQRPALGPDSRCPGLSSRWKPQLPVPRVAEL